MRSAPLELSIAYDSVLSQESIFEGEKGAHAPLGIHGEYCHHLDTPPARQNALKLRYYLQGNSRTLLPSWRVAKCLRVPTNSLVEIIHHPEHVRASFGGLQTCGSVHVCSVCGTKINERRSKDIGTACARWTDRGGSVFMVTFTLQHSQGDSLADLAGAMNEAYRKMRQPRRWQLFEKRIGLAGSITAREYTYGAHGWHPHMHSLWFVERPLDAREARKLERWIRSAWRNALERVGRFASVWVGVHVSFSNKNLADYLVKRGRAWTVGDELTKTSMKRGRAHGSRSVAQLLHDAGAGDEQAGRLFQEYADWTYRKNALVWSPGLRALVGLEEKEKTDEEVAAEEVAGGRLLVTLERGQWYIVLGNDARAEVLLVAAAGEVAQVCSFLAQLGVVLEPWQLIGTPSEA